MNAQIVEIDYRNPRQANDLRQLLGEYARDPAIGSPGVRPEILARIPEQLAEFPTAFSVMAYVDDRPAGLINCFFGFSTFAGRRLVNIHDVVVTATHRGQGLSRRMLERVESIARAHGCCKLTLEVLEGNPIAHQAYLNYGFRPYTLDDSLGQAYFLAKSLSA